MKVALTVNDFLRRAELIYPDRVAIVDEPDQPAESWGSITYREMASGPRRWRLGSTLSASLRRAGGDGVATTRPAC